MNSQQHFLFFGLRISASNRLVLKFAIAFIGSRPLGDLGLVDLFSWRPCNLWTTYEDKHTPLESFLTLDRQNAAQLASGIRAAERSYQLQLLKQSTSYQMIQLSK